jgi:hypothetical protein
MTDVDERNRERIERARITLAKVLSMLESTDMELGWVFEKTDWNPDVRFQIQEACIKLGFALATLTRWWEDDEEIKDE